MPRNLDMTAVRAFVTVAEAGGVTRAAGLLNLTQSAVSMQIKRLEETLGTQLLQRTGRGVGLTPAGDQVLSLATRLLEINDDIFSRMTGAEYEGEITLGVPHDIVYPLIPSVLRRFAAEYPRVKVHLLSSFTRDLKRQFSLGEVDVMLTTEDSLDAGGETLAVRRVSWIGAPGGQAWKARPLRLAFERSCIFRPVIQRRLDAAGIPWELAVDSDATRSIDATVSADLAVSARLDGSVPDYLEPIAPGHGLPELQQLRINLYVAQEGARPLAAALGDMVRMTYGLKAAA